MVSVDIGKTYSGVVVEGSYRFLVLTFRAVRLQCSLFGLQIIARNEFVFRQKSMGEGELSAIGLESKVYTNHEVRHLSVVDSSVVCAGGKKHLRVDDDLLVSFR